MSTSSGRIIHHERTESGDDVDTGRFYRSDVLNFPHRLHAENPTAPNSAEIELVAVDYSVVGGVMMFDCGSTNFASHLPITDDYWLAQEDQKIKIIESGIAEVILRFAAAASENIYVSDGALKEALVSEKMRLIANPPAATLPAAACTPYFQNVQIMFDIRPR